MPRDINNVDLSLQNIRIFDMIRIAVPGTTIRATNAEYNISSTIADGSTNETYLSGTGYLRHTAIPLTAKTSNVQVQIVFDAVDLDSADTPVGLVLANSDYAGADVQIHKKIVAPTESNDFTVFKGLIDNFSIKLTDETSQLTVNCSGPFANFNTNNLYGFTSQKSQHRLYPTDEGLDFSQRTLNNVRWEE